MYLKEYYTKIINYEIKEMIQLTCEENRSYKKSQVSHICKKKISTDDDNKSDKVRDRCHYTKK